MRVRGLVLHCLCSRKGAGVNSAFSTLAQWWVISAIVCQLNLQSRINDVVNISTDDLRVRCCQDWSRSSYAHWTDPTCKRAALGL